MKFIFTLVLSLISISQVHCQHDSLFVRNYFNKLIVKPFLGAPQYNLTFDPVEGKDSAVSKYTPNTFGIIGITLAYKGFSLNLSKRAGDIKDEDVYGKTKYSLISAKITPKRFTLEFTYQKYKGYADLNTRHYYKSSPDSLPYIVRNDLQNKYYKLKGIYQINKTRYSFPAAFSFTQRQLKSAGALFIMGSINHLRMEADSSFFPYMVRNLYGDLKSMSNLRTYGFGGAMGGGYTLVFKQLFLSGILFLGLEIQNQKYFLQDYNKWKTDIKPTAVIDSRISFGVNGNRAFGAITIKSDVNNLQFTTFRSNATYTIVTLDFGYRFNAPKIVEKGYSKTKALIRKLSFIK